MAREREEAVVRNVAFAWRRPYFLLFLSLSCLFPGCQTEGAHCPKERDGESCLLAKSECTTIIVPPLSLTDAGVDVHSRYCNKRSPLLPRRTEERIQSSEFKATIGSRGTSVAEVPGALLLELTISTRRLKKSMGNDERCQP